MRRALVAAAFILGACAAPSTGATTLLPRDDPSFVASETIPGMSPSAGPVTVTIKRDTYGVPHIYSDTDAGVVFGAGYVVAEDRSLLIDQARFNGVAALIDMPGVPAIELVRGLYSYKPSERVVDEVTAPALEARLHARHASLRGPARAQRPGDADHDVEEVPVADERERREAKGRREPPSRRCR